jgi:hypothetical protein
VLLPAKFESLAIAIENKVEKSEIFSGSKYMHLTAALMPPNHHNSTTIYHPKTRWKMQKPLQKRYSATPKN